MRSKFTSRKFWLSVAAFLGSIAASIAGIVTEEKWITVAGVVCGVLSTAIYAAAEAYVDAAHAAWGNYEAEMEARDENKSSGD